MTKSLAKIKQQIAKLQREADSIQSTVIARIKREIAQHGLTAEQLFGSTSEQGVTASSKSKVGKSASKVTGQAKPAKYADGRGNTWHGIGKRPQWIHAALDAGHSLADFLVGTTSPAPVAKKAGVTAKPAAKAVKKRAAPAKAAPAKKTTKPAAAAKPAPMVATKNKVKPAAAKEAALKKSSKAKAAAPAAEGVQTSS
jgi:DNA-binding protein H-NS